ncbi:MAG: glycosyltransferase [Sediminibacterium sp.]|jgi:hypothetical protein
MARKYRENNIVIGVFSHPEFYPPTLNAIQELSKIFDNVYVLSRNVLVSEWDYPSNVQLVASGKYCTIRESEQKNVVQKFFSFFYFTFHLFKLIRKIKPAYIQVCDAIPLFSLFLLKKGISKKIKIWYHNHDVCEIKLCRKFSIGWFAAVCESKMFPKIDVFTLPAEDRKQYFPLNQLKGTYYFLPNYPSSYFYSKFHSAKKLPNNEIKLVYQGSIGPGHGLEEIIEILHEKIENFSLSLHLKGFISDEYKSQLQQLSIKCLANNKLTFYGITAYQDVPLLAVSCDIGIGIHTSNDIMNSTLGTSSNKIYEYAALGLPVLLFDNKHFKENLSKFQWAFFTNLEAGNLKNTISTILQNQEHYSQCAIDSFQAELNYENHFSKIKFI